MTVEVPSPVAVEAPASEVVEKTISDDVIVDGPALKGEYNEKKLAKIRKEGGKKGVEIEGAADMGGLQFFNTTVDLPEGNLELLIESMKAMNAKSNPSEEERKGGAGKIGKILLNCTDDVLCAVCYVPKHKTAEVKANEWLQHAVDMCMGGPTIAKAAPITCPEGCPPESWAVCTMKKDGDKNVFPLKMRDTAISEGYNYLKKKGLFPDADDDDDDFVFGDEDFP
jgi:hypothetical protein